jgi:hypothetical protein
VKRTLGSPPNRVLPCLAEDFSQPIPKGEKDASVGGDGAYCDCRTRYRGGHSGSP